MGGRRCVLVRLDPDAALDWKWQPFMGTSSAFIRLSSAAT
jgi:hypothetical protein